ncbi:MAG: hypothetical protein M0T75_04445 [Chloroflexi bacterium]|nr:hypothetical protein [Chloroflexota bacterium]
MNRRIRDRPGIIGALRIRCKSEGHSFGENVAVGGPVDPADRWNGLVYGTAVPPTTSVRIDGFAQQLGGRVVDGSWLVLLPVSELYPPDIQVEFQAPDGTVVTSGSNGLR